MKNSKTTTAIGIGMILGSMPCTLAGVLILYLMASLNEGRAAGRDVAFDVIGVLMMTFFAYLIALVSCLAGLFYFAIGVRNRTVVFSAWHWFCLLYPLVQVTAATIYLAANK
ncbi:hypothetical protein [Massilia soli]|uniref:Uncharacterized protein n=1 Tax=Massilia soli TaxID=2792854 RepID=A0ABS7SR55_9BURK|nr:hypothetical protein [Massilia soli]MBZ2208433.1 hypothetical protein [Massilia soli]